MDLYATGFNAWNQLRFERCRKADGLPDGLPDDLPEFTKIFHDKHIVEVWASISATIVETSDQVRSAGQHEDWFEARLGQDILSPTVAMTSSGSIASYSKHAGVILQYAKPEDYLNGNILASYGGLGEIIQIVAYDAGFAALGASGQVWTWGDSRFPACLGRLVTRDSLPTQPGLVLDLLDLPTGKIRKISSGGYLLMALTEGDDLYAWGGHPGQTAMIEGLSQNPIPIVVEENDIVDFAVGASHAIILTQGKELFVIGANSDGQLGLPQQQSTANNWTKVAFPLNSDMSISAVACGPRNTFAIVDKNKPKDTNAA